MRRVAPVVAGLAALAVALDFAGVAGYRLGLVLVGLPMILGSGLLVWRTVPDRDSAVIWGLVAAVLGLVVAGVLGSRAPYSRGALEQKLDALTLPFFEERSERSSGTSWCRPRCPVVERVYDVPDVGVQSTMVTVAIALLKTDLITEQDLRRIGPEGFLRVRGDRLDVEVRVDEREDRTVGGVRIRYVAHRS